MNSSLSSDAQIRIDTANLPVHIAIIMDGNGRWAKKHHLKRIQGHEKGSEAVRIVVRTCREIGIRHLTLYAFSTENWQRPQKEVDALMALLRRFLKSQRKEMLENNIRLNVIGQIERLPQDVQKHLHDVMALTQKNNALHLHLALSYGGRAEIVWMTKQIAQKSISGQLKPQEITEELVADHLYSQGIPDPDLLIRTGGEMRISNFLLWQIAYTELFVTETLWPDFDKDIFVQILKDYQSRERRFGRV